MDHVSLELGFLVGWEAQDSYHTTWERNTWEEEGGEMAAAMGGWGWEMKDRPHLLVCLISDPCLSSGRMNCNPTESKERTFERRNLSLFF